MVKLPKTIDDIPVVKTGDKATIKGQVWQGMRPKDETIERHWEFSLTTGRILDMTKEIYHDYDE